MLSIEQAIKSIVEALKAKADLKTETIPLSEALNRVCAQDVVSPIAVPPFDNSAMDGYAVNVTDLPNDKSPDQSAPLKVSQRIPAGIAPEKLEPNTAARIFTGGVIPQGANAVVIQENCQLNSHSDGGAAGAVNAQERKVTILKSVQAGANIRKQGQDIQVNDIILSKGTSLSSAYVGLLASVGCVDVKVYKKLKVALFSTGDELVEPGSALKPGQIYNSNRPMMTALCHQLNTDVLDLGVVEDSLLGTVEALRNAAQNADLIISSGGVSVGEEDHVKDAVEQLGQLNLWKINIKPGKPVAFGEVGDTPFLGLPGNPVSSFVTFQLIAKPAIHALQGLDYKPLVSYPVIADFAKPMVKRQEYLRVKLAQSDGAIMPTATLFDNQSSGVLSSLCWADGLLVHQADTAINQGQTVSFIPLMSV